MDFLSQEAIARMWGEHSAALVLYAQQWCEGPEDIVQEAFLLLMRQTAALENPKAWLYRVVRNRAINAARSGRRRTQREAAAAARGEPWFEPAAGDGLDAAAATAALKLLDPQQREAIVARLWGGLTFEEIAQLSGSTVSTVYRCYQRGLQALRERLGWSCPTNTKQMTTRI